MTDNILAKVASSRAGRLLRPSAAVDHLIAGVKSCRRVDALIRLTFDDPARESAAADEQARARTAHRRAPGTGRQVTRLALVVRYIGLIEAALEVLNEIRKSDERVPYAVRSRWRDGRIDIAQAWPPPDNDNAAR